jgi:hypothetical protein
LNCTDVRPLPAFLVSDGVSCRTQFRPSARRQRRAGVQESSGSAGCAEDGLGLHFQSVPAFGGDASTA